MVSNENCGEASEGNSYEPTKQHADEEVEKYMYPYILKNPIQQEQGAHHILGEVYAVNDEVLAELDILEGHPSVYLRQPVEVLPTGADNAEIEIPPNFPIEVEGYVMESDIVIADLTANVGKGRYTIVQNGSWRDFLLGKAVL